MSLIPIPSIEKSPEPFRALEDNWGEIDANLNRGLVLAELGRERESEDLFRSCLELSLEHEYYLGMRLSSHLTDGDSPETRTWRREYEELLAPRFKKLFMPPYVLILRGNLDRLE